MVVREVSGQTSVGYSLYTLAASVALSRQCSIKPGLSARSRSRRPSSRRSFARQIINQSAASRRRQAKSRHGTTAVCTPEITAAERPGSGPAGPRPAPLAFVALSDTDNAAPRRRCRAWTVDRRQRSRVPADRPPADGRTACDPGRPRAMKIG